MMPKPNDLTITIYDRIGLDYKGNGITADSVIKTLSDGSSASSITVNFNSPGGSVFEAFAIYNALVRHKARVVMNIDGIAASSASIVAMAGDEINIAENATLMIHDPTLWIGGTSDELRKRADELDALRSQIVATYKARTNLGEAKIREMMTSETWLSAADAVRLGFADNITPAKRAAACFDLSEFHNVPDGLAAESAQNTVAVQPTTAETATDEDTDMSDKHEADAVTPEDADKLRADGERAVRARFDALDSAFEDKVFVAAQFKAGNTVDEASAEWTTQEAVRIASENEALSTKVEDLEDKLTKARAELAESKAPKPEDMTVGTSASGGAPAEGSRQDVIAMAVAEYATGGTDLERLTSELAFVNCALSDAGKVRLTDDEAQAIATA